MVNNDSNDNNNNNNNDNSNNSNNDSNNNSSNKKKYNNNNNDNKCCLKSIIRNLISTVNPKKGLRQGINSWPRGPLPLVAPPSVPLAISRLLRKVC